MSLDVAFCGELLATHITLERFFTCVRAFMGVKAGFLREAFMADVAFEGTFPGVGPHVNLEG